MCWIGVVWPQLICPRVRPNAAATLSRSAGLGVQRPSTIASTRCSSSPARSASCFTSILCSAQSSSTLLRASIPAIPSSGRPAELRAVAVQVLHRRLVPPGDLVLAQAEGGGDPVALRRARRPAPLDDRPHPPRVQPAPLGELPVVEAVLAAQLRDGLARFHDRPRDRDTAHPNTQHTSGQAGTPPASSTGGCIPLFAPRPPAVNRG